MYYLRRYDYDFFTIVIYVSYSTSSIDLNINRECLYSHGFEINDHANDSTFMSFQFSNIICIIRHL